MKLNKHTVFFATENEPVVRVIETNAAYVWSPGELAHAAYVEAVEAGEIDPAADVTVLAITRGEPIRDADGRFREIDDEAVKEHEWHRVASAYPGSWTTPPEDEEYECETCGETATGRSYDEVKADERMVRRGRAMGVDPDEYM